MRAILLTLVTCLLMTSCISATREREAHCLAATMSDVWQTEQEMTSAEHVWRTAQQNRSERAVPSRESSAVFVRIAGTPATFVSSRDEEEDNRLYQRIVVARLRHGEASKWYGLVARRVQTRIEEDEMLYPVLGMLATSAAIVLYPVVRWNVRSVLWDGVDPDADDDPVQSFCASRLGDRPSPRP